MDPLTEQLAEAHNIVTDALGFELKVCVEIGQYEFRGEHRTRESSKTGKVAADAPHTIKLSSSIAQDEIQEVIAHECYHLFYSVRHLITADEETEAEVFGQLCKRVNAILAAADAAKANGGCEFSDVTRELIERDKRGRRKYGVTLDRKDLSAAEWLQHMAEELLDAAGYALAAKRELGRQDTGQPLPPPPEQTP